MVANSNDRIYAHNREKLKSVTKARPCEICQGDHKCSRGHDGFILCGRTSGPVPGFVYLGQAKGDAQFGQYRRERDPRLQNQSGRVPLSAGRASKNGKRVDGAAKAAEFSKNLTAELRSDLARSLALPEIVLDSFQVGFN